MIEINNLTKFKIDEKSFSQVAKKVLSGENKGTESLSLAFVSKSDMQKLNKKHRGKDNPTDVLAFCEDSKFKIPHSKFESLGEVVICPEVVKQNAEKYGVSTEQEMLKVFIHGILHLLGYNHEKLGREAERMEEKEKYYLSIL